MSRFVPTEAPRFLADIGSQCYLPPLKLEDGGEGTFLETSFEITGNNQIRHWLKNVNTLGTSPAVWRYAIRSKGRDSSDAQNGRWETDDV